METNNLTKKQLLAALNIHREEKRYVQSEMVRYVQHNGGFVPYSELKRTASHIQGIIDDITWELKSRELFK